MYISLVDKKYMFLLCNGIVGFIMGNFKTLLHGTAMNIVEETEELRINHTRKSEMKNVVALLGEQPVSKKEVGEVVALLGEQRVSKGDGEVVALHDDDDDNDDDDDDDDDDDEINDTLLSSEDLNKKCEEFIRKMKAGIRSESRKLLTS
ncbi:BnaC03g44270D [Brassica napus]|uniref:BnaC03g44270D protein n=1 Tax=Brassica napus TaxID=3708 RepID=A0A078FPR1_BRANA|nr:BnaC03g44270D [Brassica napus]